MTQVFAAFLASVLLIPSNTNEIGFLRSSEAPNASENRKHVLVFSRTTGFRHQSIANGVNAISAVGLQHDFDVTSTEDPTVFSDAALAPYDAVIFLNTTGDVLNGDQESAFERFIQSGKGFVGIHSAADTEYGWSWYGGLVGAYFDSHPAIQTATVRVLDVVHPSTDALPRRWTRTDEWYNYRRNPRGDVHVLATLDEASYSGGTQGYDHPIAWCHNYAGGRSWYTGGGHTPESFDEPSFRDHLLGGINYATGAASGDCGATLENSYRIDVIHDQPSNPMGVAAAPDGSVYIIERTGRVRLYDPGSGAISTAAQLNVFTGFEDGLLGIALDPDFGSNRWLYLFYSPAGARSQQHVSRFNADGASIDLASEKVLLVIPVQRDQCCHSAGDLEFGPDGSLLISTGDNTNPFESDGYAPIDERPGRSPWDAQKSSANIEDLRGKILRIRPEPDGTYSIPEGNLFPSDGSAGRPEIYAMGLRNPFRIDVDPVRGWVYWGDVGPDASSDSFLRGPRGYDEWNQARTAGNFGWPYCIADNKAYRDYDFATGASSRSFVCPRPVNESPNNTGAVNLPPAQPAWIWYPYGPSTVFPEITDGPGRTAMAGPVYRHNPSNPRSAMPAYFDGSLFIYEWSRRWLKSVHLDEFGDILAVQDFLPSTAFRRPIDMHIGPDGSLYVVEWGSSFGGDNGDARVSKITYRGDDSTSVGNEHEMPAVPPFQLSPVYPNPASAQATVGISIAKTTDLEIAIFDLLGRRVRLVRKQPMPAGVHEISVQTGGLPDALYFVRVTSADKTLTHPLVVIN